jgi:hypothetical protein
LIAQIEKRMSEIEQIIEDGWNSLKKRGSQFNSFDLTHKQKKRAASIVDFETLSKKLRGHISQASQATLTRLDDRISDSDRELLLKIQVQISECEKDFSKYEAVNIQLSQELEQI